MSGSERVWGSDKKRKHVRERHGKRACERERARVEFQHPLHLWKRVCQAESACGGERARKEERRRERERDSDRDR